MAPNAVAGADGYWHGVGWTGMSRSAIPLFAKSGVKAIHIGYNGACIMPPSLPPAFVWEHPETGTELIVYVESSTIVNVFAFASMSPTGW